MKTKIIYISGGETFEMAQIRAAFEEVKMTLGLDKDTVLFGVPIDADSALAQQPKETVTEPVITEKIIEIVAETDPQPTTYITETETLIETEKTEQEAITENEPAVVPILSVLGGGEADSIITPDTNEKNETDIDIEPEKISLDDVADDAEPIKKTENTLEQLLESMTPLREDIAPQPQEIQDNPPEEPATIDVDDTDATLAQLASEFAQTEDKIVPTKKTETSGKIGKLKNILPFKKSKQDDSGLMGDLFGWAGIAANDEDFSLPGFFTQNTQKKQGA